MNKQLSFSSNTNSYIPESRVIQGLAKIGSKIPDKVSDVLEITRTGSMKRVTHFSVLATCVLFARYIQARNKDEKREILTRDTGMLLSSVFVVPFLEKLAGIFINRKTGVPVSCGDNDFLKNLNPENGIHIESYRQIKEWLGVKNIKAFDNIKDNFLGFCEHIKTRGGDLVKCFNILDKNSINTLNDLAHNFGHQKGINNNNILGVIKKAEKSADDNVKQQLEYLKGLFVKENTGENELFKKASHSKSLAGAASIAFTAVLLGVVLPKFNIWYTKKIYKDKNSEHNNMNTMQLNNKMSGNSNMMNKFEIFKSSGKLV